jgi:hypothetical protein
MGSNYVGTDLWSPNLTLQTDGDSPSAAIFRVPNERLLDNDVHVRNRTGLLEGRATSLEGRAAALEAASNVTALVATTGTIAFTFMASRFLGPASLAGARWGYSAQIQAARGATATATNVTLRLTVGAGAVYTITHALNTTNGYTGTLRFQGEISFHAAPGPSASFSATCIAFSTIANTTPVVELPTPDLTLVGATDGSFEATIAAGLSAATAGVSFTPVSAQIWRLKS